FPPGFTPKVRQQGHYDNGNPNIDNVVDTNASPCKSVGSNTRIAKEVGNVEGVPLHAWSRATFAKIGSKWGEMMDLEDGSNDLFARKRICIKTNHASNILETFKIIVKRKVFWVRAKELFVWSPMFKETPEVEHSSDVVSTKGEADNVVEGGVHNDDEESDTEAVSDTYFGDNVVNVDNAEVQGQEKDFGNPTVNVEVSSDPFNIYGLLNNRKKDNGTAGSNTTPPFPPGFTPKVHQQGHYDNGNPNVNNMVDTNASPCKSVGSNTRIAKEAGNVEGNLYTDNRSCGFKLKEGGSILDILDEMIKDGQTMGFSMVGCTKDMEGIIGAQGEKVSLSVKRLLWNYLSSLVTRRNGECLVMGDFNEVRRMEERWGSVFNARGADVFNSFISDSGLTECELEGYSFTWAHPSAKKMSKLDRFLMTNGLLASFPHISAISLDRHLSDHRPILLREVIVDYGATPFCFYHSWLGLYRLSVCYGIICRRLSQDGMENVLSWEILMKLDVWRNGGVRFLMHVE
nr:RNA-directed DNA polymerase, eukaryota [Tanacetum cinerariifolium]